jgi:hypothetical protein
MALDERIKIIIDVISDKAEASVRGFRQSVADADSVTGKFKAGAGAAFESVKANAAQFAMAAGSALVAFGVQSVKAFQDTALQAGKLSEALGISVEDASRLMEVSGDLGIEVGTVQGAIQRMNKTIADGKLDRLGLAQDLVRGKDGAVDSYQSFVNLATSIGKIADPTERAQKAQQVFGKSYGEMAELMEMSAGDLRAALDGVSEAKVIDEAELAKARQFRDSLDELKGKIEDLSMSVGEGLVPALIDMADGVVAVNDAVEALPFVDGIGDVISYGNEFFKMASGISVAEKAINLFRGEAEETDAKLGTFTGTGTTGAEVLAMYEAAAQRAAAETNNLGDGLGRIDRSAVDFAEEVENAKEEVAEFEQSLTDADAALDRLKGNVDQREAWRNMYESLGELMTLIASGEATWDELSEASDNYALAIADVIAGMTEIPPEVKTKLYQELEQGNMDAVLLYLEGLKRGVELPIRPKIVGQGASLTALTGGAIPKFDSGGVMPGPRGEHNLALVAGGETILPTHKGPATPATVPMIVDNSVTHYHLPAGVRADDVVNAERRYRRTQGPS